MTRRAVASSRLDNQRGTVLIQVAVALLALLALSSFVFDSGVMWVSRGQSQNAADAGALSGAISLAFNSPADQAAARARAIAMAQANQVWNQAPIVTNADVTFPVCPPGIPGPQDNCIKVDVFRNQARGNALPTFFAKLAGVVNQGAVATATAQVVTGDTTNCLRPWAVVDRWQEFGPEGPAPLPSSTFDRYSTGQGNSPPRENDLYIPPSQRGGTGYTLPADLGRQFGIKMGASGGNEISSGWFRTLDLPRADTTQLGNNTVQNNILSCNGLPASFANANTVCPASIPNNWDDTAYWAARGCYRVQTGATVGSTRNSIQSLVARDSGARWSNGTITGSQFDPPASSPRVVPVGVMDIDSYLSLDPTGNNGVLRMVNIFGFFIEGMGNIDRNTGAITLAANGQSVIGRIMTLPATASGNSTLPGNASFLVTVRLVR
ncbi:MAG: pilus assembly protein TadG-related protein [Vicinamibacterales bacterium]